MQFVAKLKIDAIYALYPESFCDKNLAIRKVFAYCDSGQVGSGKSSFLLGLIGELWAQGVMELEIEMNRICQNVLCKVKKSCTQVAYVSQQPWIQNLTLRCND